MLITLDEEEDINKVHASLSFSVITGALNNCGAWPYPVGVDCADVRGKEPPKIELLCAELGDKEEVAKVGRILLGEEGLQAESVEVTLHAFEQLGITEDVSVGSHRSARASVRRD